MVDPDRIVAALHDIALRFEGQYQSHEQLDDCGGWGQFLDGPRPQRQIGLYGTSAGLLVLSLAERGETPCTLGAMNLLRALWIDQRTGYGKSKFCQNPRLAFFALCLRNTLNEVAQKLAEEVEAELISRISSNGKWGDYWVDNTVRDASPRYLATAVSTLCLGILEPPSEGAKLHIEKARAFLELTLATNPRLTTTEKGLVAAAILGSRLSVENGTAAKEIKNLSRQPHRTLSENHCYPYEYQYAEYQASNSDRPAFHWNRDSVFLYSEIMMGIAGFLPNAPTELRLRAEGVLRQVLDNISTEGGSFRPLQGGRISSVEQAWCAVFLALAKQQAVPPTGTRRKVHKVRYALFRQWKPTIFTEALFPIAAMLTVSALGAIPLEPTWRNVVRIIGSFVIFGLYGPKVVERLFPGR